MNPENKKNSENQGDQPLPSYVSYLSEEPAKSREVTYLPAIDLDSFKSDDESSTGFIYQKKKPSITMKVITACVFMLVAIALFIVGYCGIMVLLNMYHSNHRVIVVVPKSSITTQHNQVPTKEEPFCVCSITRTYRKSGLIQRATLHVPLHGSDLNQPSTSCSRICAEKRPEIMHQLDEQAKEARIAVRNELASDLSHQMNHLVHLPGLPLPLLSFPPTKLELVKGSFDIPMTQNQKRTNSMVPVVHPTNPSPIAPKRKVFIIRPQRIIGNTEPKMMTGAPERILNEMIHDGMNMINQVLMNDMQHDLVMMKKTVDPKEQHPIISHK